MYAEETICAPATANGIGAIALIRVSGSQAFPIVSSIFKSRRKDFSFSNINGNTIHYGTIMKGEQIIDEVLISVFRSPHSYTSEDLVEISCHASPYIQKEIMQLLINNGARPAQAGEFTMRAFVNGKMDLSQAEAVADVIASQSEASHRMAFSQLRGGYSRSLTDLREKLLKFSSLIELELDFGEEDVEFADRTIMLDLCKEIKTTIEKLTESFDAGNAIKNGIPVAIVGEPNVGKSTLLNALLNEERAIVSDIPGTTRDTIEDQIVISGIQFRFIDTAGIRHTTDTIETLGIEKTFKRVSEASVVLFMIDIRDDIETVKLKLKEIKSVCQPKTRIYIIINKVDTLQNESVENELSRITHQFLETDCIAVSAKKNMNVTEIKNRLVDDASLNIINQSNIIVSNARHYEALVRALESIDSVEQGLRNAVPGDIVALEIRQVLFYLGSITGQISNDEMLGYIFKNFCIGK